MQIWCAIEIETPCPRRAGERVWAQMYLVDQTLQQNAETVATAKYKKAMGDEYNVIRLKLEHAKQKMREMDASEWVRPECRIVGNGESRFFHAPNVFAFS